MEPAAPDDRAAKLAAMQQAATDLDKDRENRLRALEARESAAFEAEDAARARSSKYGGKGEFMQGINRRAGELALGDRVRRGVGGLTRDD